jgi:hypothetical protein
MHRASSHYPPSLKRSERFKLGGTPKGGRSIAGTSGTIPADLLKLPGISTHPKFLLGHFFIM